MCISRVIQFLKIEFESDFKSNWTSIWIDLNWIGPQFDSKFSNQIKFRSNSIQFDLLGALVFIELLYFKNRVQIEFWIKLDLWFDLLRVLVKR